MSDTAALLLELNRLYRQLDTLVERVVELEAQRAADRARIKDLEGGRPLLTPKETSILKLIAQGHDNVQIATRHNVSERTVRGQCNDIYRKIKVRDRLQAARYAWRHGYVRPNEAWETVKTMQWRDVPKAVGAKGASHAKT